MFTIDFAGRWWMVVLLACHGLHAVPKPKDGTGAEDAVSKYKKHVLSDGRVLHTTVLSAEAKNIMKQYQEKRQEDDERLQIKEQEGHERLQIEEQIKQQKKQQKLQDIRAEAYDPRVERVVNLCIFNDASELCLPWVTLDIVKQGDQGGKGAVMLGTLIALLEKQNVLCSKTLWITIQNMVKVWQRYIDESEQNILNDFKQNILQADVKLFEKNVDLLFKTISLKNKLALQLGSGKLLEQIRQDKDVVARFNLFYTNEIKHRLDEVKNRTDKLVGFENRTDKLVGFENRTDKLVGFENRTDKLVGFEDDDFVSLVLGIDVGWLIRKQFDDVIEYQEFFYAYIAYQIIMQHNYECRAIDDNYLIFYDVGKGNSLAAVCKDMPKYDYKQELSLSEINAEYDRAYEYRVKDALGQNLLSALQKLIAPQNDMLQKSLFNIFLNGHGDLNDSVAGLSVKPKTVIKRTAKEQEVGLRTSEFTEFLQLLNNRMRVKTLTILSCYAAGQKHENTPLAMQEQFNNSVLEDIKYPIVFIGSFASVVYSSQIGITTTYRRYFALLNEHPARYKQAINILQAESTHNLASIKMPNTSWFTAVSSIKDSPKTHVRDFIAITNTKVLDRNQIEVPFPGYGNKVKNVWLQANYIPKIIIKGFIAFSVPDFLPVQRYNQNYIIDTISCDEMEIGQSQSFNDVMNHFFKVQGIEEPINIVIKNFVFKNVTYKNVYIFMYKEFETKKLFGKSVKTKEDGYVYTGPDGGTYIVSWINDHNNELGIPKTATKKAFDPVVLQRKIAEVEKAAKADLKSVAQVKQAVDQQKTQQVPDRVQKSRDTYAQMTQEAKDQMVYSVSKKIQTA